MLNQNVVIVAGHLCLDLIPSFPRNGSAEAPSIRPGSLTVVGGMTMCTGGAVSNTGIALARSGTPVQLIGRTGDDEFGRITRSILRRYASDGNIRTGTGENSSYTIVLSPPGIDRFLFHDPGTNDTFSSDDVDFDAFEDAALFHFGYPPLMRRMYLEDGQELIMLFRRAKQHGLITSLDMAFPNPDSEAGRADWNGILRRTLPAVDLFTPSVEEILSLAFRNRYEELIRGAPGRELLDSISGDLLSEISARLLSWGAGVLMLKCGRKGIYLRTGDIRAIERMGDRFPGRLDAWANREIWIPAFRCDRIISTAGAGDCAIAGFLAAMLRGGDAVGALRFAALFGYQNLSEADAFSGIRSWDESERMLGSGEMLDDPLDPATPGWLFDARDRIWLGPNDRPLIRG